MWNQFVKHYQACHRDHSQMSILKVLGCSMRHLVTLHRRSSVHWNSIEGTEKKALEAAIFAEKKSLVHLPFETKHMPLVILSFFDDSRMLSCSLRCCEIFQMPSVLSIFRSSLTRLWWYSPRKSALKKPTHNLARWIPEKVSSMIKPSTWWEGEPAWTIPLWWVLEVQESCSKIDHGHLFNWCVWAQIDQPVSAFPWSWLWMKWTCLFLPARIFAEGICPECPNGVWTLQKL